MANENKGARSYKGQIIGDNMSLHINIKWLIQLFVFAGMLVYGWYQLETRIQDLERNQVVVIEQVEIFVEERQLAEELHIQQLEDQMQDQKVWIEQELGINLNPFSWGKRKK